MDALIQKIRWIFQGRDATSATLQTLISRIVAMGTNLITGILAARLLGADGRGEQAAMILWPQFLSCVMTLGIPSAIIYNLKRYPQQKSRFFMAAMLISLVLGAIAALTGCFLIPHWMSNYSASVIQTTQAFMLITPLLLLSMTFSSALEACELFGTANQARYVQGLSTLLLLLTFWSLQQSTPTTVAAAYLLPTIPMLLVMGRELRRQFPFVGLPSSAIYIRLMSYGVRAYGIEILGTLYLQIGGMLVVGILSAAELGWYAVALSLSRVLNLLQSSVVTVLLPKTAARPVPEVIQMTGRATRVSLLCLMVPTVIAGAAAPFILSSLYGPEFIQATATLRILLLESLVASGTFVLTRAFMALGQPGLMAVLQIAGLAVAIPATVILVSSMGLLGASLALLASSLFRLLLTLICFPLVLKVAPPAFLPRKSDVQTLMQIVLRRTSDA